MSSMQEMQKVDWELFLELSESPIRSDRKPGNIARNTSCRIAIVSLQAMGDFKPLSNRRASLSRHSSARSGSTDLFSKAAMISSGKCSASSHVFSLGQ